MKAAIKYYWNIWLRSSYTEPTLECVLIWLTIQKRKICCEREVQRIWNNEYLDIILTPNRISLKILHEGGYHSSYYNLLSLWLYSLQRILISIFYPRLFSYAQIADVIHKATKINWDWAGFPHVLKRGKLAQVKVY